MICLFFRELLGCTQHAEDAEYSRQRSALRRAGLKERTLRRMAPDDRVAALERARLDPYDYIYLAC